MLSIVSVLAIELAYLLKDLEINLQLFTITLIIPLIYYLLFNITRVRENAIKLNEVRVDNDHSRIVNLDLKKYVPSLIIRKTFVDESRKIQKVTVNSANQRDKTELSEKRIKELEKSKMHLVVSKKIKKKNKSSKLK